MFSLTIISTINSINSPFLWFFCLISTGILSGLLAGLLGIGGGVVLVSFLQSFGYNYQQSIATSSLAIVITSISGSWQNWRMGYLKPRQVIYLGIPAIITTLIATKLVVNFPDFYLQIAYGCLLIINIYLTQLKQKLAQQQDSNKLKKMKIHPVLARLITGGIAGFLAGMFGIGGGLILVPFQMIFLGEKIKSAIQTSLGVIVLTSIFASIGHYHNQNILFLAGTLIGLGGLIGSQISTRFLPKIPEKYIKILFNSFLIILAIYSFYLAIINAF